MNNFISAIYLSLPKRVHLIASTPFKADEQVRGFARFEIKGKFSGTIQVLPIVEAAIGFNSIFKIVIPIAPQLKLSIVRDIQRRKFGIRLKTHQTITNTDIAIEQMVLARQVMVISESREWSQRKLNGAIKGTIRDHSGILTVNHKNLLFKTQVADAIGKDGKGIQADMLEIAVAVWMDIAKIAIAAKFKSLRTRHNKRLFEFGQRDKSTVRLIWCWNEQAVVPPRVHPNDGRTRKSTHAIGFKPLPPHRLTEIAAYFFFNKNTHNPFPFTEWTTPLLLKALPGLFSILDTRRFYIYKYLR